MRATQAQVAHSTLALVARQVVRQALRNTMVQEALHIQGLVVRRMTGLGVLAIPDRAAPATPVLEAPERTAPQSASRQGA